MTRKCTAVVFDLDGTLIDSIPDVVGALNRLLVEEGRRGITLDEGRAMVGEGAGPMVERAFAATGDAPRTDEFDELITRYLDIYRRFPVVDTTIFPGVEDALKQLADRGMPLGICTNKPHGMSELVVRELDLAKYFPVLIGGDALDMRKPDPRHLFAVLDQMGCDPTGAVYVGDSPIDSATARAADIPFIGVSYGYSHGPASDLDVDILIDSFFEFSAALKRLENL